MYPEYASQVKSIGFYDPADSGVVNRRGVKVQERGMYFGGYLSKASDSSAYVTPLVCVIGDNDYQLRVATTVQATVTGLDPTIKYVVCRWTYTGSIVTDFMDILGVAVGGILANDLIVGVCNYSGATLTGFDYGNLSYPRTEPNVASLSGKIEAEQTPSMYVWLRLFNSNYGSLNYRTPTQKVGVFTAPVSFPRIDVIYVDTDGGVKIFTGVENSSPVIPLYQGKIVLAEITLSVGMTAIPQASIKDTRAFIGQGVPSTLSISSLVPVAGNALKYLRVNAAGTAIEYIAPTYS